MCYHIARFRVAQPQFSFGGLGRRGYFEPQRPTFVVPAQLRAYDFGSGNNGMASARCLRFNWQLKRYVQ